MRSLKITIALQLFLIGLAVTAVYGAFLEAPIFFDDHSYFTGKDFSLVKLDIADALNMRWLPYASIHWSVLFFGDNLFWLRFGNLFLHILNGAVLFIFLRRLFQTTSGGSLADAQLGKKSQTLDDSWLAFFSALIFVMHPAATFGVAYLVQRSILMATCFALLTWWLFLEGLLKDRRIWLLASCLTYLLAGFSKEHAILVPAVSLALVPLVRRFDQKTLWLIGPAVVTYVLVALLLIYRVKAGNFVGQAYEPYAVDVLAELGITREQAYPLSVLNQSYLYFKYLLLWFVPNPSAMSITMGADFARHYASWPQLLGPLLLAGYLALSIWMLRQRGEKGLLGFALLAPALLFAVELATVRVQEIFVAYRSYLWMPCLAVALPTLIRRLNAMLALAILVSISILLAAASVSRLKTLADPVLLWREALEHTLASETRNNFTVSRAHHNLGQSYIDRAQYREALVHLNEAIRIYPVESSFFNDRAVIFLQLKMHSEALTDFGQAISMEPYVPLHYFGRAETYLAMGRFDEARNDYSYSCSLGKNEACAALQSEKLGDSAERPKN